MQTRDVKKFYNESLARAEGLYEERRWFSSPQTRTGYAMTKVMLERYLKPLIKNNMYIAELGPGPGTWTKELLTYADDLAIDLIDISREMLAQAKNSLPMNPLLRFFETDFMEHKPDRQYDVFISLRAFEYLPAKDLAAQKISALLKSGGKGFLVTKYPHYRRQRILRKAIPELHSLQIEPSALKAIFEKSGFEVETVRPVTFVFPKAHQGWLDMILFGLFSRMPLNPLSRVFTESYVITFLKK